jgi:CheY-like chemotaxis protein
VAENLALPGTILIVDDDDLHRPFLGRLVRTSQEVRDRRATILTATSGEEALEVVRAEKPDVVVCDLLMPRMDGFAFCEKFRNTLAGETAGLIVISGMYRDSVIQRRVEDEFGGTFFAKPNQLKAMVLEVGRLLAERVGVPAAAPRATRSEGSGAQQTPAPTPVPNEPAPNPPARRALRKPTPRPAPKPAPRAIPKPEPRPAAGPTKYRGKQLITDVHEIRPGQFRAAIDVQPPFPDGDYTAIADGTTEHEAVTAAEQEAKQAIDRFHERNSRRISIVAPKRKP